MSNDYSIGWHFLNPRGTGVFCHFPLARGILSPCLILELSNRRSEAHEAAIENSKRVYSHLALTLASAGGGGVGARALHGAGNLWGPGSPMGNGWKWVNFQGNLWGGAVTGGQQGRHNISQFLRL